MNKNLEKARALLAEATGLEISAVPEDANIDSFDAWDSMSHMRLILSMESQIGEEMPPEAILEIESLEHIAKYISPV